MDEDDPDAGAPAAPAAAVAPPATAARENTGNRYTLQVKAARDKAEADAFIAALRRAGYKPHVVLADVPGKGRFYRVRVGRFASMAEAREFQRSYKMKTGEPDAGFVTDL
ncbi:MAG: SPOR domain-containing protein [Myxococcales bacterium]|nr:SPOR domain-containing protein [Myxococcales bacterium]